MYLGSISTYVVFGTLYSFISNGFFRYFQIFAIITLFYLALNQIKNLKYITFPFLCFFGLEIMIIINHNYNLVELKQLFFDPNNLMSYFIPLVILCGVNYFSIHLLLKYLLVVLIILELIHIYLIYLFPINNFTDTFAVNTVAIGGLIFLFAKYTKRYYLIFSVCSLLFYLILGVVYGRRSTIILSFLFLIIGLTELIFGAVNYRKRTIISFVVLFVISIFFYSFIDYLQSIFTNFELSDRLDVDSRSEIFTFFFKDFDFFDLLFGRGITGSYYNPINYWNFDNSEFYEVEYRTNIENGYLFFVLKGGVFYLFIFLFIVFKSIVYGIKKSFVSNRFSLFLIVYLIDMLTFGQPSCNMKYGLVWIAIAYIAMENFNFLKTKFD